MGLIDCTCKGINSNCPKCYGRGVYDPDENAAYELKQKSLITSLPKSLKTEVKLQIKMPVNEIQKTKTSYNSIKDFTFLLKNPLLFADDEIIHAFKLFSALINKSSNNYKGLTKNSIELLFISKFINLIQKRKLQKWTNKINDINDLVSFVKSIERSIKREEKKNRKELNKILNKIEPINTNKKEIKTTNSIPRANSTSRNLLSDYFPVQGKIKVENEVEDKIIIENSKSVIQNGKTKLPKGIRGKLNGIRLGDLCVKLDLSMTEICDYLEVKGVKIPFLPESIVDFKSIELLKNRNKFKGKVINDSVKSNSGMRLSQAARKLNVNINAICQFLKRKGIEIENNPNTRIDEELYNMVLKGIK